jgi:hypothetical protein
LIKQQKIKYFGNIKCHEGLEKKFMEGYIKKEGGRGGDQKGDGFRISQTICK